MTSEKLRTIRKSTGATVRQVAAFLEFDAHSRYSYYESPRFKGDLPISLARRLAYFFSGKVPPEQIMELAGLSADEAKAEAELLPAGPIVKPLRIFMEVRLPNEASLTRMFDAMLESAGAEDPTGDVARTLALLLPNALAGTTGEFAGEGVDPDYRPVRGARSRTQTTTPKRSPPD